MADTFAECEGSCDERDKRVAGFLKDEDDESVLIDGT